MRNSNFSFREIDSECSFEELASRFGANNKAGVFNLSNGHGIGRITTTTVEDGFNIRAWDIQPEQPVMLKKIPVESVGESLFHIVYLLKPAVIPVENIKIGTGITIHKGVNVLFVSGNTPMEFDIPSRTHLKAIDISLTISWMVNAFMDANEYAQAFINHLKESSEESVLMDSSSFEEYRILATLHDSIYAGSNAILQTKASGLTLLSLLFNRMFSHSPQELMGNRLFHYSSMIEVEKILTAHLQKKLPSLDRIAHQVALSVSSLKRHFKSMYGKNIYEYYLDRKMDLARHMLIEKPLSINEVAALFDYENVSSFIETFKKHHGFCPGTIRKNGMIR